MTTATLLARVSSTADQVRDEARELDPRHVALTLLFTLPFAVGWLIGAVVRALLTVTRGIARGVWTVFAWTWTAMAVGFRTARPAKDGGTP